MSHFSSGPPHAPVEPPVVYLSEPNAVLVSWNACPFDGHRRVTSYELEKCEILDLKHKYQEDSPAVWQAIKCDDRNCALDLQRIATNLIPGKSYQFRVRGVNELGPGDYGPASDVVLIPGNEIHIYQQCTFFTSCETM